MNILLLAGSGALDLKVLYCLQAIPSINTYVCSSSKDNIVKFSRYKKNFWHIPWDAGSSKEIEQYCKEHSISAIIPGDIAASEYLFNNKSGFSAAIFPCCSEKTLDDLDNKWTFAKILMDAKLATPSTVILEGIEGDIESLSNGIGYPQIVKPVYGESSHGVVKIDSYNDLSEHIGRGGKYAQFPLILQEFIPGVDIDLSFIADKGEQLIYCVQRWLTPDQLSFQRNEDVIALGEKLIRQFEYSGPGHFDMRIDDRDGKVYVIECNPRFWFSINAAVAQGLNFVEQGLNYTLGKSYTSEGAEGTYTLPKEQLSAMLRNPTLYRALTSRQVRGMLMPLLDPLPHLVDLIRK
jgi:biotin carboxylase